MKIRPQARSLAALACFVLLVAAGCSKKQQQSSEPEQAAPSTQSQSTSVPSMPEPGKISGPEAHQLVDDGATLLDVRTPGEYNSGHIDGALNIPIQRFDQRKDELKALDEPVVVYCQSGVRSARAFSDLRQMGLTKVYDLGGIGRW